MANNKSQVSMKKINWPKSIARVYSILLLSIIPFVSEAQLVNNGANIMIYDNPTIVLNDLSFQNNGLLFPWFSTFSFTGSSPAFIGGSDKPEFFQLIINKPASSLQLQKTVVIRNWLQFTEGLVDLNNNNIQLYPDALLIGEKETSRIIGPSGGFVELSKSLNAPVAENPGNIGVAITTSENLGWITIRRGHQSQVNRTGGGNSILRYYEIEPANNNSLNAYLQLNYFDAELNGLNENNLTVWKSNRNGTWTDLFKSSSSVTSNFVGRTGISDFTRFTLSSRGNALPLIWSSFNTECLGGQVRISWKTEQEQNTLQFVLRRSLDGRNWTTIGSLPAAGNSNTALSYSYTDQQSSSGPVYYQIQQQDIDGRLTVSPVLLSNCNTVEGLKVFPNPVLNECWVSLQLNRGGNLILQIFDVKGSLVQMRQESVGNGANQIRLSMNNLAKGIYTLVVRQPDGNIKTVKLEKY